MYIESVQLKNFRNYDSLELTFDKGTNIFYGNNAQGKTIYAEQPNLTEEARTRKSLSSEKKKHISG